MAKIRLKKSRIGKIFILLILIYAATTTFLLVRAYLKINDMNRGYLGYVEKISKISNPKGRISSFGFGDFFGGSVGGNSGGDYFYPGENLDYGTGTGNPGSPPLDVGAGYGAPLDTGTGADNNSYGGPYDTGTYSPPLDLGTNVPFYEADFSYFYFGL